MTSETILYIIIAGVLALIIVVFMYGYKTKISVKNKWIFGVLRFITFFSIFLLLINPKFRTKTYTIIKPNLQVLVDNSSSVNELNQTENVLNLISAFKDNKELNEKFSVTYYSLGSDFKLLDTLTFSEKNTNISEALISINTLFKDEIAPTILITDGNQTLGNDYEFATQTFKNPIYPIILGDQTKYIDLRIEQLNSNRYAFLKNKFPVEAILVFDGLEPVSSQFIVKQGNRVVYKENVSFSEKDNTKILSFALPASSVGIKKYSVQILPLNEEKNKVNNKKQFAVEVIDQATNVLIVSTIVHPDIGMFKKSISSNEQHKVEVKKPKEAVELLNDYQLIILYQPDRTFSKLYSEIKRLDKRTFTITGLKTDWNFLNNAQNNFRKEITNQTEIVGTVMNLLYGNFKVDAIGFDNFKPLETKFGELELLTPNEILLYKTIFNFTNNTALLATTEINEKRDAIFDAEGIWKWRAQSYLENGNFEEFDNFVSKIVQYLASHKKRRRLEVTNDKFYYNNKPIRISAQYFDKNFVFDSRENLNILVINTETKERYSFPLFLKRNYYEVNLSSLDAGSYTFTVSVKNQQIKKSGSFSILDFNVEQQFLNADVTKLSRVATNTEGKAYFITKTSSIAEDLIKDDRFKKIQKQTEKVVSLIDWKYLLALIIASLSIEWFLRKYNGLI